jgi:hypothetical protein
VCLLPRSGTLSGLDTKRNGVMGPERPAITSIQCCEQTNTVSNLRPRIFGGPVVMKIVSEFGKAVAFSF